MKQLKRPIPNLGVLLERKATLTKMRNLSPSAPLSEDIHGLETGNSKTGTSGKKFASIFVWNLPPLVTCPAASYWCLHHCYNGNTNSEKYPVNLWTENWWLTKNSPHTLKNKINEQLISSLKPCAVRLHSSGDFYSKEYVDFWYDIIKNNQNVFFWGYTRSWIIKEISPYIERINTLDNVNIFASWDEYMGGVPDCNKWKYCLVCSSLKDIEFFDNNKFISCPEQYNDVPNCASCGLCMKKTCKNIVFILH